MVAHAKNFAIAFAGSHMRIVVARPGLALVTMIAVVLLAGVPYAIPDAWIMFLTGVFIWIGMVWAWDILAVAGYVSLAAAGWYGLGAYSTFVLMSHFGLSFFAAVGISALLVGLFSVVIAIPLFRLRGHYFIMGTLIIAEVIYLVMNEARFFGIEGASLVHFPPVAAGDPDFYNRYFYLLALGFLVTTLLVFMTVKRSRVGLALRAMGQDEVTAETLGVATAHYKLLAFGISSAILAVAGGLTGYWVGFIQQGTVFTLLITVKIIVINILGGTGTFLGPLFGVVIVQYVEQIIGPTLQELNQIIYGLIVMLIAVLLPSGVVPSLLRALRRYR